MTTAVIAKEAIPEYAAPTRLAAPPRATLRVPAVSRAGPAMHFLLSTCSLVCRKIIGSAAFRSTSGEFRRRTLRQGCLCSPEIREFYGR